MRTSDVQRYHMLRRVLRFHEENPNAFPASTLAAEVCDDLRRAIDEIQPHMVSEKIRPGPRRARARTALVDTLSALRRCARVANHQRHGLFDLGRSRTDFELVTLARVVRAEVEREPQLFFSYGVPHDFVAKITAQIDELNAAIALGHSVRTDITVARVTAERAMSSGLRAVRQLDVLVEHCVDDPPTLAVWRESRRIESSRRRTAPRRQDVVRSGHADPPASGT